MKAKNILMTLLLAMGAIAAKAAGYPPELALVSQPVMVYNPSSITVYYDVENIGDYTYRGNVIIYLDPDYGYSYAEKWVKVRPGSIKRIAINIPAKRIRRGRPFTIMPYYELGDELYSFTTFEYFEPITFYWEGPRNERWVVINIGPRPRHYTRPGYYRYYYDGFRPPMPPPGHEMRPMDPKHHTYSHHHNNGGYPASHGHEGTPPPAHNNGGSHEAPSATVRPNPNAGSMSSGSHNNPPAATNGAPRHDRPKVNDSGSSSGRTPSSGTSTSTNSSSSRPRSNSSGTSSSGRVSNSSRNSSSSATRSSSSSSRNSAASSSSSSSSRSSSSKSTSGSSSRSR